MSSPTSRFRSSRLATAACPRHCRIRRRSVAPADGKTVRVTQIDVLDPIELACERRHGSGEETIDAAVDIVATVTAVAAIGIGAAQSAEYTMKFGVLTFNDTQHFFGNAVKEAVEKATNGRVEVKVFPRGQLGSPSAHVQGLQLGTIEAFMAPIDFFAGWQEMPDNQAYDNAFKVQWELFIRHLFEGGEFPWNLLAGAKGVQLAELGLQSWRERRWCDVPVLKG